MKKEFNINVHKSLKARKAWGWKMKLSFIVFLVILVLCSVMLYYGFNHKWDPETEPEPVIDPQTWWQWLLLVLGSIIAVAALVAYPLFVYNRTKAFYLSQADYWKTEEYKKQKEEALKVDLHTFKKSQLKWYKKMGYITTSEMKKVLEDNKNKKQQEKKTKH